MKEKDKYDKNDHGDFIRYANGKMTDREKNDFERELQRDPFAADAAEGFSEISSENAEKDLAGLKKELKSRITKRQRFVYYRIAASVAVLMIISSVFIVVQRNTDIAKEESGLVAKQVPLEIIQPQAINQPEIQIDEKVVITESRSVKRNKDIKAVADDTEKTYPAAPVTGVGYGVKKKAVSEAEEISLDEVVLIGYGEAKEEVPGISPAMPAGGKRDFDKYVEENIRVPETLKSGEKAIVIVNFIVRNTGAIDSLKVIRSPGDEFSAEAKRLIIEGPHWSPATRNDVKIDDEVRIRIVFK